MTEIDRPKTRCLGCEAPILFSPGAGSRLCPFCGHINLVREQMIAVPAVELKTDEVFRLFQKGQLAAALDLAHHLRDSGGESYRLALYRASILLEMGRNEDAIYGLIELGGQDASIALRSDVQAKLSETLLVAGRVEESVQAARRSLDLVEGHPGGSAALARSLVAEKNLDEAAEVVRRTLEHLDDPWKITFPPQRSYLLLLLATIQQQRGELTSAIAVLEQLLFNDFEASVPLISTASRALGLAYLEVESLRPAALPVLRLAAQLDPENRRGLLDALRIAVERSGGDFAAEIEIFKTSREEFLAEIRSALGGSSPEPGLRPEVLTADLDLTVLGPDPDERTDLLERAGARLGLQRFDRGSLYPLRTIEDFQRWVIAWRLRERIRAAKREVLEQQRLHQLKAVRESRPSLPAAPPASASATGRGRRWLPWVIAAAALLLVGLGIFTVVAGERFLDDFEGSLVRVECLGDGGAPPCRLWIAVGDAARQRYLRREKASEPCALWLDSRTHADGTIHYPLDFPWGALDSEAYLPCVGQPIAKMRFTLRPLCSPRQR